MLVHKPPGQVELQVVSEYYAFFCTEIHRVQEEDEESKRTWYYHEVIVVRF